VHWKCGGSWKCDCSFEKWLHIGDVVDLLRSCGSFEMYWLIEEVVAHFLCGAVYWKFCGSLEMWLIGYVMDHLKTGGSLDMKLLTGNVTAHLEIGGSLFYVV
jgi:hypothetical protein